MAGNEQHDQESEPSFNDPADPRWSRNPNPSPPRNPYLDMPLDGPPIASDQRGAGPGFADQGDRSGQNAGGQPGYPQRNHPQQAHQPGYMAPVRNPSGVLAIVSLVAGIIGLVSGGMLLIPQVAAIICGHMALRREPHMRGVAIAGLVTGYVGVLFLVLVMALFIVAIASL